MFASSLTVALASLAVVAAVPEGWTYGGCMNLAHFEENITPRYVDTLDSAFMSVGECLTTCTTPYAGIDGEKCYCGTVSFPLLDRTLDGMCDTPCPGYAADTCGGASEFGWISMYSKSANTSSSSSTASSSSVVTLTTYSATGSITASAVASSTTSTIYTTEIQTITSCAETVTNCPARTSTTVYSIGTTVVPCSTTAVASSVAASTTAASSVASNGFVTSTASSAGNSTVKASSSPSPTAVTASGAGIRVAASWTMLVIAGVAALL